MKDEQTSNYGPICPHCKFEHQAIEGHHYDRDFARGECHRCGKEYEVRVEIETTWTTGIPYTKDELDAKRIMLREAMREAGLDDPRHIIRPTPEPARLDTENGDRDLSIYPRREYES